VIPQINNEIKAQEFMGEYYMGDGFFACRLKIQPNRSFYVERIFDFGANQHISGTYAVRNHFGEISLEMSSQGEDLEKIGCLAKTFLLVKWQNRRYLFYNDNDERSQYFYNVFCNGMENDKELQRQKSGSIFFLINKQDRLSLSSYTSSTNNNDAITTNGRLVCPR
jgi:hypothetical protein